MSNESPSVFHTIVYCIESVLFVVYHIIRSLILLFVPASLTAAKSVKGEIVLVTGGGSGLGRLLAVKLAALGANVVIWDVNEKGLEETAKAINDNGGTVYSYKCDLTQRTEVYRVAGQVKKDVGDVTILINNAGYLPGYYILDSPDHMIQRTFDVNSLALFWTTKAFVPKMVEKNQGHIVNIASMAGHMACPKLVDYSASKSAAVGFSEGLRFDLATKNITGIKITVICPMFMSSTGMMNDAVTKVSKLPVEKVADRTVSAILREELHVMLPAHLNYVYWLKWLAPWPILNKLMVDMVSYAPQMPDVH